MKTILNPKTLLWSLGVAQPATVDEVLGVFRKVLGRSETIPTREIIAVEIDKQVSAGHVMRVTSKPTALFSLTHAGHLSMPLELRKLRDKTRIFLLHKARRAKNTLSRGVRDLELAGASPAVDASTAIKGSAANIVSGRRPKRSSGQPQYWPRSTDRFKNVSGPDATPRDIRLPYLSFYSESQLRSACDAPPSAPLFDVNGIGVALGISPGLLTQILYQPERHYRVFSLPKKGGGTRQIESPRIFLKTIQGFLADYLLNDLRIHRSVHSYRAQRSIISNASQHQNQKFVANIDIKNFFGSINQKAVARLLEENGFHEAESGPISRLCINHSHLPQGAPTSPLLSNAALFHFDADMENYCASRSINYTRYADDITFSGQDRSALAKAISVATEILEKKFGLSINKRKSRIASQGGQQRVTGVVVNVESAPPRQLRRKIRAMFHNTKGSEQVSSGKLQQLEGYLNYLNAFPKYKESPLIDEYRRTLRRMNRLQRRRHKPTNRSAKKKKN